VRQRGTDTRVSNLCHMSLGMHTYISECQVKGSISCIIPIIFVGRVRGARAEAATKVQTHIYMCLVYSMQGTFTCYCNTHVCCSVLQCILVQGTCTCSTASYIYVSCILLQINDIHYCTLFLQGTCVLQCVAVCIPLQGTCVLQCVAVHSTARHIYIFYCKVHTHSLSHTHTYTYTQFTCHCKLQT